MIAGERLFPNTMRTGTWRSMWVDETLRKRRNHREYHQLVQELHLDDGQFKAYFRMSRGQTSIT